MDLVLSIDNRNYLVWGYRLDLLELKKSILTEAPENWKEFLEKELIWVLCEIQKDIRNNSAWNYRHNLVREIQMDFGIDYQFTCEKIRERPVNESAWNYFNALSEIHFNSSEGVCL